MRRFFTFQLRTFYLEISLRSTQLLPFLKLQSADGNLFLIVSQRILLPKVIDLVIQTLIHFHHWVRLSCFIEAQLEILATEACFGLFVGLSFKAWKLIVLQCELMGLINEGNMLNKLFRHFFDDIVANSNQKKFCWISSIDILRRWLFEIFLKSNTVEATYDNFLLFIRNLALSVNNQVHGPFFRPDLLIQAILLHMNTWEKPDLFQGFYWNRRKDTNFIDDIGKLILLLFQ